jgi:hypothetical protein
VRILKRLKPFVLIQIRDFVEVLILPDLVASDEWRVILYVRLMFDSGPPPP